MKFRLWIYLIILLPGLCPADIITVGQDGVQLFSTIQAAISYSTNGDIVQISPGTYYEHLDTHNKYITLRSTYYATGMQETIDGTIVHASLPQTCLSIHNNESVSIDGLTFVNNAPEVLDYAYAGFATLKAGGIAIYGNASVNISNCVVRNCYGQLSGGIYFAGKNFYMSNTKIYSCYCMDGAGGLFVSGEQEGSIAFDGVQPNSIYDNTAPLGMDICIGALSQALDIVLETFSVVLTEPDWFWLWFDESSSLNVTVQNGYFDLVDSDLYVSWEGDDSNSGLTPQEPLRTIAKAFRVIAPGVQHSNTIHLAMGEYNFSGSGQYFPLNMKSNTRLVGEDPEYVILNMENTKRPCFRITMQKNIAIENITFVPHVRWRDNRHPIEAILCEAVELRNLHWDGNQESAFDDFTRIKIIDCDGVICEHITAKNATTNNVDNMAVEVMYSRNVFLNNIYTDRLVMLDDGFHSSINLYESDVTARNIIISNGYSFTGGMFHYQAWVTEKVSLDLSNFLFINNDSVSADMGAPIYIFSNFERAQIRNCTFAYNDARGRRIMNLRGYGDIYNSIFYNPTNYWLDLILANVVNGVSYNPTVSYSLFTKPVNVSDSTQVALSNLMIGVNPRFAGDDWAIWDATQPSSYHLSPDSPCINAGTPDASGLNLPPMDLAGNYRIWDDRVDMGCYEFGAAIYVNVDDPSIPSPPEEFRISLYPNPVRINALKGGYTYIEFAIPAPAVGTPKIHIYNLKGQKVKSMEAAKCISPISGYDGQARNGRIASYSTVYDCTDSSNRKLSSGIYLIKAESGSHHAVGKFTIIK